LNDLLQAGDAAAATPINPFSKQLELKVSIAAPRSSVKRTAVSLNDINDGLQALERMNPGFSFDRKAVTARSVSRGHKGRQIQAAERKVEKLKREKQELDSLLAFDEIAEQLHDELTNSVELCRGTVRSVVGVNKRQCLLLKQQDDRNRAEEGETDIPASLQGYGVRVVNDEYKLVRPQ